MKDFLVIYTKTNNQKVASQARGRNVAEVQSLFNRVYPDVKIISIKKLSTVKNF